VHYGVWDGGAGRMVSAGRLDGVMEMRGGKFTGKVKDTEIEE